MFNRNNAVPNSLNSLLLCVQQALLSGGISNADIVNVLDVALDLSALSPANLRDSLSIPSVVDHQPSITPTIGTRIRQLRKDQGISAADLAHMIGEHEDIITQWESDIGEPVLSFAIPLCQALRCDLNWLITGEGSNVKPATPAPVNVMKGADLANIGVRIESRRNEMGMSPLKLAEKIDTSRAMILEWETGKAIPHSGYYDKLAKALNTTVTWLMTGKQITA